MAAADALPLQGWWYQLTSGIILADREPRGDMESGARVYALDAAGAFPLGHPTTRLCLDLLVSALTVREVARLVEIGCGSGVLCLAAALLGVPRVIGVDLADAAVRATRANARRHALDGAVAVVQGSTECLAGWADLVAANLPAEVLAVKGEELRRLAGQQGRLLLSGFRESDETVLWPPYAQAGWRQTRRAVKYFQHPELPATLNFNWVAWLLSR